MPDKEIKEAKSLRWLANQFPKVENPKDNGDRLCNCINLYCTNAAELIERQAAEIKNLTNDLAISRKETKEYKAGYKVACSERNEFLEQLETAENKAYKEVLDKVRIARNQSLINKTAANKIEKILKELVGGDNA